jgi:hypothetical protein
MTYRYFDIPVVNIRQTHDCKHRRQQKQARAPLVQLTNGVVVRRKSNHHREIDRYVPQIY